MRIIGLALAVFMVMLSSSAFSAEDAKDIRKITVSGKAENTLEAQKAEVYLSIKIVSRDMGQSHAALTRALSGLEKELKTVGLEAKDIKRSLVLQGAEYNWEKESNVLKGYYAECYVDVTVNDIKKIADVYRTLALHKDLTIQSTEFKRNDEFEVRKAEFEKALLAAKKKAEFMAVTLGAKIGKVHAIQEAGADNWIETKAYKPNFRSKGESSGDQESYGTVHISASVVVEFELE
jgi:uncharacterized protein YggE